MSAGMRIIISPAKRMREEDTLPCEGAPHFLPQAEQLFQAMRAISRNELQALWNCGDAIADQNVRRLHARSPRDGTTPALLAYEGIQYRYMAPGVFTAEQFRYVQRHLRILSGLYGVLRPFDGVIPYRLEMQARLRTQKAADLYGFWGSQIADLLWAETDCIVNLASKEYSLCVSRFVPPGARFITCIFGQQHNGKIIEKGTLCKMARGEMVRYLAETEAEDPRSMRNFSRLGYSFDPVRSDESNYVFVAGPPSRTGAKKR